MKYQNLTVAREYGSGGAEIASLVAAELGWKLLDRNLIEKIARRAGVGMDVALACDEHTDSWLHRMGRPLMHGEMASVVATLEPVQIFDSETMARLTRDVIEEAAAGEKCVIVGRAGQCILQNNRGVFHAFVYAPWQNRVACIRERLHAQDAVERLIRETDSARAAYVRLYFGQDWTDRRLYDLMVSSARGARAAADLILFALHR